MRRVSELVGKSIVTNDTGEQVGKAADLLVSDDGTHLVGIVVSRGVLGKEQGVLPFDRVHTLGTDVIVVNGPREILDADRWQEHGIKATRSSAFTEKRAVTTDGRALGRVSDLCVDERSGDISGYEVTDSGFAGLVQRHRVVTRHGPAVVGPDVVLVANDGEESEPAAEPPEPAAQEQEVR